jgi:hypothetical protein
MLNADDRKALAILLQQSGWAGTANDVYWYKSLSRSIKLKDPGLYNVMKRSKKQLPLLINHPHGYVRVIAKYRMEHNI